MKKSVKRTSTAGKKRVTIVHSSEYVKRPSNVTKKAPSKRLKARRTANTVKGRYPNPTRKKNPNVMTKYAVFQNDGMNHTFVCACKEQKFASAIAQVLNFHARKSDVNFSVRSL